MARRQPIGHFLESGIFVPTLERRDNGLSVEKIGNLHAWTFSFLVKCI